MNEEKPESKKLIRESLTPKEERIPIPKKNRAMRRAHERWTKKRLIKKSMTLKEARDHLRSDKVKELRISDEMVKIEDLSADDAAMVMRELYGVEVTWVEESRILNLAGDPARRTEVKDDQP